MRIPVSVPAGVLFAGLFLPALAAGQPASQSQQITVQAVGNFMGFSEGFCENPGGTYDWESAKGRPAQRVQPLLKKCLEDDVNEHARWLGGAIGAAKMLEQRPRSNDQWLVVPANNRPYGSNAVFLEYLRRLDADAIGVGPEDFDPLMRGAGATAQRVVDWMRQNTSETLPFIASNVAVRTLKDDGPEDVDEIRGYSLHGVDGRTIGWTESLTLHMPDASVPGLTLTEASECEAAAEKRHAAKVEAGTLAKHDLPLKVPGGFRPATCYWLAVAGAKGEAVFRFRTDAALTPAIPSRQSDGGLKPKRPLEDFAVVTRPAVEQNIVVVSLIGEETKTRVRTNVWSWKSSPSDERQEVLFLDPIKTLNQIVERATLDAGGSVKVPPIVILLSALEDEQTRAVLAAFPEVRFAVLGPESELLGRAERRTDDDPKPKEPIKLKYSGDLGFVGVVDELYPQVSRFLMRPEWVGETLVSAGAMAAPVRSVRADDKRMLWSFTDLTTDVQLVPGAPLAWRQASDSDWAYVAGDPAGGTTEVTLTTDRRYRACTDKTTPECASFYAIWSLNGLAPVVGASLRDRLHTDLAVVSPAFADPDFRLWIEDRIKHEQGRANWISPFILKRLLFASPRMVRGFVAGSDLPGVLQKIVAHDDEYCVSGLGAGCSRPGKAHPERLEINGRRLDPRLHYSIVLPDALAELLALPHDDEDEVIDLLETTSQYLHETLVTEASLAGRYRGYLAIPTLAAGVAQSDPSDANPGIRANLPVAFSGAKDTETLTFAVDADLAAWDAVRWAVRIPMTVNYERRDQAGTISYGKDDFSVGARFDWKVKFFAGELRPFLGVFADGPLREHVESLTAKVKLGETGGFVTSRTAADATKYTVEPNRYKHFGFGADILGLRQFPVGAWKVTLSNLGARFSRGYLTRAPYGVAIDGKPVDAALLTTFLSQGPAAALNEYFDANQTTFLPTTTFEVLTRKFPETSRRQIDAGVSGTRTSGTRTYKADFTFQYRHYDYNKEQNSDFLLHRTQKYEFKIATPVWPRIRLTLTPNISYQRATIRAVMPDGGKYPPFSLFSWDVSAAFPISFRWGHGKLFQ